MSVSNVVSLEIVLAPRSGTTLRSSMPRASRHSRRPSLGKLLHQLVFVGALQIGDDAEAALRQPLLRGRSHAEDEADRLVREHRARFVLVERGKAARLVEVGGDLGQELVARTARRRP